MSKAYVVIEGWRRDDGGFTTSVCCVFSGLKRANLAIIKQLDRVRDEGANARPILASGFGSGWKVEWTKNSASDLYYKIEVFNINEEQF